MGLCGYRQKLCEHTDCCLSASRGAIQRLSLSLSLSLVFELANIQFAYCGICWLIYTYNAMSRRNMCIILKVLKANAKIIPPFGGVDAIKHDESMETGIDP